MRIAMAFAAGIVVLAATWIQAQAPPARGGGAGQGRAASADPYPQRPPADPAVVARGRALFTAQCGACHGADARGGENGGPNLLRSQLVLGDQNGELIAEVVRTGRPGTMMPPMLLSNAQVADIAAYIHSFPVGGADAARDRPETIVVGRAEAGRAAFQAKCAGCHSATGDLRGLAERVTDPKQLQDFWLMPSTAPLKRGRGNGGTPSTATVTLASGEVINGRLTRLDDFVVTIVLSDGMTRSFTRKGAVPRVEIRNPLQPHKDLLPKYTDPEIHDITAYLVTLQ